MTRRTLSLATLPLFLLVVTAACSDAVGPNAGGVNARGGADDVPGLSLPADNNGVDPAPHFRRGADDLPGDDNGVDIKPHFRRGADDATGVDAPKAGGADDPITHT